MSDEIAGVVKRESPYIEIDGNKLEKYREDHGLEIVALAHRLGFKDPNRYYQIRKDGSEGRPSSVRRTRYEKFCSSLNIARSTFLYQKGKPTSRFDRLRESPLDDRAEFFETLIADRTSLVADRSRAFVFQKVAATQSRARSSASFLVGDPGSGKSTIAALYAREHDCARHFNIALDGTNDPRHGVANLCLQLRAGYSQEPLDQPLATTAEACGQQLRRALDVASKASAGEPIRVVIDALDELDLSQQDRYANPMYVPPTLPPGVHLVFTSRRTNELRVTMSAGVEQLTLDLRDYQRENETDARQYIDHRFDLDHELRGRFAAWGGGGDSGVASGVASLVDRSACNFMYLRHAIDAISRGESAGPAELPAGLLQYYQQHFTRMQAREPERLSILLWLANDRIRRTARDLARRSAIDPLTVQQTLDEWHAYLSVDDEDDEPRYAIYHESFREFLCQEKTIRACNVRPERLDQDIANANLEDFGWL